MAAKTASSLLIATALLALALALGGFSFALQAINAARANAGAALNDLAAASGKARILGQEAQIASQTRESRGRLSALAIPSGGDADYISTLEDLAALAHVGLNVSSVAATPPAGGAPGTLSLTLQTAGSWAASMRFLELVETEPFAQALSAVSFTHDSAAKAWQGTLTLTALSFDSP